MSTVSTVFFQNFLLRFPFPISFFEEKTVDTVDREKRHCKNNGLEAGETVDRRWTDGGQTVDTVDKTVDRAGRRWTDRGGAERGDGGQSRGDGGQTVDKTGADGVGIGDFGTVWASDLWLRVSGGENGVLGRLRTRLSLCIAWT